MYGDNVDGNNVDRDMKDISKKENYLTKLCSINKEDLDPKSIKFTNGVAIKFSIVNNEDDDVNIEYKSKDVDYKNLKQHETGCYQYIPGKPKWTDKYNKKVRNDAFKTYEHSISSDIKQSLKSIIANLKLDSVDIYIIRHLKAEHNNEFKWNDPRNTKHNDTHILRDEIKEAVNNNIHMLPEEKPDYNFVSDLRRTRETLCEFYEKQYDSNVKKIKIHKSIKDEEFTTYKVCKIDPEPIVLPNIHEIDSDCTESTKPENILKGYSDKKKSRGKIDNIQHSNILDYYVDVSQDYYDFYNGKDINENNNYNIVYEVLKYLVLNLNKLQKKLEKKQEKNINIFVVTHSSTIACFLKNIIQDNNIYKENYKELENLLLKINNLLPKIDNKSGGKLKRRTRKQRTRKQRKLQSKRRKNNKSKKSVKKRKNLNKNKRSKIRKSKY